MCLDQDGNRQSSIFMNSTLVVQHGYKTFPDANQNFKIVNSGDVLDIIGQE